MGAGLEQIRRSRLNMTRHWLEKRVEFVRLKRFFRYYKNVLCIQPLNARRKRKFAGRLMRLQRRMNMLWSEARNLDNYIAAFDWVG